jgi:hypothetical protein
MSAIRCKYCELPNFADAVHCKRCGNSLRKVDSKRPRRFSFISLIALAAAAAFLYYSFGGFERSLKNVNDAEANRLATQAKDNPNGLSRSEYERQRANQYGGAVRNSNSLNETQKHNDEIRKAMNQSQGSH